MYKIAGWILDHKGRVLISTIVLMAVSLVLMFMVNINYSLSDYLPDSAPSTKAIKVLNESFSEGIPNLNVYVPTDSVSGSLEYKRLLEQVDGVESIMWLDDVIDVNQPLALADQNTVSAWFTDEGALFLLVVDDEKGPEIVEEIRAIIGEDGALSGDIADHAYIQTVTMAEVSRIIIYVVPLVLVVLLLTTDAWFTPVLFLASIGVAILLNEGTNIIFSDVSYVTQATSAILQLAVSMDYAVFLLHAFARRRDTGKDVRTAMQEAMTESAPAIAASMLTTLFGFLSLTLMDFKIGPDMGLVLAKGVLLSYISVVVFLPIMVIYTSKLIDRTRHRKLVPSFRGFSKVVVKICKPVALAVVLIIIPCFLAQQNNTFIYGSSGVHGEDSQIKLELDKINEIFGSAQQMVLLVPQGDGTAEKQLAQQLLTVESVSSVVSYDTMIGAQIPDGVLDESQLSQLRSGGYSRIIIYASTDEESEEAFLAVERIRETAAEYYGDEYHLVGNSVVNYDLKEVVSGDNLTVMIAGIVSIGLVILVAFRSLSIPVILLLTIEGAIYINLAIPYFTNMDLNYIGYQIISSVQLGATVDYGILMTQHYLAAREKHEKHKAVVNALTLTAPSVLTPALILFIAGMTLGVISSNAVISQLGSILGRGALISVAMVLIFLPALFIVFDGLIQKTTLKKKAKNEKVKEGRS